MSSIGMVPLFAHCRETTTQVYVKRGMVQIRSAAVTPTLQSEIARLTTRSGARVRNWARTLGQKI